MSGHKYLLWAKLPWAWVHRAKLNSGAKFSTGTGLFHENPLGLPNKPAFLASKGLPIKQNIRNVNKIMLVASGKGGVGKSTVSVNLAMGLKQLGHRVGILDADIFGPSIPKLLNLAGEPRISQSGNLLPLANYGLPSMSMGYLVDPGSPVVWRGLMVMKALQQLLFEVEWPVLDYLIIDMPPGTGDTQLTISQQLNVHGAIIVSTPQDIALIDAIKGISMFEKVHIPILGLVQNMSFFICPNCHHESHIFGSQGAIDKAREMRFDVLASIPLHESICQASDDGKPIVMHPSPISNVYLALAKAVVAKSR